MGVSSNSGPKVVTICTNVVIRMLNQYPETARSYADSLAIDVPFRFRRAYRTSGSGGLAREVRRTLIGMFVMAPLKSKQGAAVPSAVRSVSVWIKFLFAAWGAGCIALGALFHPSHVVAIVDFCITASTTIAIKLLHPPWLRYLLFSLLIVTSLSPYTSSVSRAPQKLVGAQGIAIIKVPTNPPSVTPVGATHMIAHPTAAIHVASLLRLLCFCMAIWTTVCVQRTTQRPWRKRPRRLCRRRV
jgi:hypothetical protein